MNRITDLIAERRRMLDWLADPEAHGISPVHSSYPEKYKYLGMADAITEEILILLEMEELQMSRKVLKFVQITYGTAVDPEQNESPGLFGLTKDGRVYSYDFERREWTELLMRGQDFREA